MDSFSATTGGASPPSGGATMTTTARTTATKRTVVSVHVGEASKRGVHANMCTAWIVEMFCKRNWAEANCPLAANCLLLTGMGSNVAFHLRFPSSHDI